MTTRLHPRFITQDGELEWEKDPAEKARRIVDTNGQERWTADPGDDQEYPAAGGGARQVTDDPHLGEMPPGGSRPPSAGGEPPRWQPSENLTAWSEDTFSAGRAGGSQGGGTGGSHDGPSNETFASHPEGGHDDQTGTALIPSAHYTSNLQGPSTPSGVWPDGGQGVEQPGGLMPGGTTSAAPSSTAVVKASIQDKVYQQLLENYPPKSIAWVKNAEWAGPMNIPFSRIDDDAVKSWAASSNPAKVKEFADKIRAGEHVNPVVSVDEPDGGPNIKVIDGHHRALAYKQLDLPVKSYVGKVGTNGGVWDQTHSFQFGENPANKANSAGDKVYNQLLKNYTPESIAWVKDFEWVGPMNIPDDRIDTDSVKTWTASHQPERVKHFEEMIKAGDYVHPVVCVDEPHASGPDQVKVIDGHHRVLAYQGLGLPVRAFLAKVSSNDGPWNETHTGQLHRGADPANKFNPAEPRGPHGEWTTGDELWNSDEGKILDLTADEVRAAHAEYYHGGAYKRTNAFLRGQDKDDFGIHINRPSARQQQNIKTFLDTVNRTPAFTKPVELFRGVSGGMHERDNKMFGAVGSTVGKSYTDYGFSSASADHEIGEQYGATLLHIKVPPGVRALKSEPKFFTTKKDWEHHQEYTFPPGTKFKVIDDQVIPYGNGLERRHVWVEASQ